MGGERKGACMGRMARRKHGGAAIADRAVSVQGALASFVLEDMSLYSAVQAHESKIDSVQCCFEYVPAAVRAR